MVSRSRPLLVLILTLVIFSHCTNPSLYDRVESIPSDGWRANNKLSFVFPISDTTQSYDIFLHVRNFQNFSYNNLWLFIEITAPNNYTRRDTFEIMLADDTGRWFGKGIGNINSMLVPYQKEISFPMRGIYTITLQQAMREDVLENIMDLGLRVQQHQ
jgi:gliding motility-associated lipoprotein GldH